MTAPTRFLTTPLCVLLTASAIAGCGDDSHRSRASANLASASTSGNRDPRDVHNGSRRNDKPSGNQDRSGGHGSRPTSGETTTNQSHDVSPQRSGGGSGHKHSHLSSRGDRVATDKGINTGSGSTGGRGGANGIHPGTGTGTGTGTGNSNSNSNSNSNDAGTGNSNSNSNDAGTGNTSDQPTTTNQVDLGPAPGPTRPPGCPDEVLRWLRSLDCQELEVTSQFGPVDLGSTSTLAYALTSAPAKSVMIKEITIHGANERDFHLDPGSCTTGTVIHTDQSCTFHVTFAPRDRGRRRTALIIKIQQNSFAAAVLQGSGKPVATPTTPTTPTMPTPTPTTPTTRTTPTTTATTATRTTTSR